MEKQLKIILRLAIAVWLVLVSGCEQAMPIILPQNIVADENTVTIKDFGFSPATITIEKGMNVTWVNEDAAQHTVISDFGVEISSQQLSKGDSYLHTFAVAGEYSYHCSIHPSMKAKVIVK